MTPLFTVVMPSYLGNYPGAAKDRHIKIRRAIDSVLMQSLQDFELFIVPDGCDDTIRIVLENYAAVPGIRMEGLPKQPIWSGRPRNLALARGRGKYAVYLDVDDKFGKDHLQIIADNLKDYDWVWFNDHLANPDKTFAERTCHIKQYGQHGTSNICHKRGLVRWPERAVYSHDDHGLVKKLLKIPNYEKITTPQYMVCHLPPNTVFHTVDI